MYGRIDNRRPCSLQSLNSLLIPRTYLVGNYLTAADVAVYGSLHPTFVGASALLCIVIECSLLQSKLQPHQYYAHPSLTRYFDHVQSCPPIRSSAESLKPAFNLISFDFDNAPKPERKADPPKKKEKTPGGGGEKAATVPETPQGASPSPAQKKEKKKEKKNDGVEESGKKKAPGGGKAVLMDDGEPRPSMIELRVGHIVDGKCSTVFRFVCSAKSTVMKHPDADGLYIEVLALKNLSI